VFWKSVLWPLFPPPFLFCGESGKHRNLSSCVFLFVFVFPFGGGMTVVFLHFFPLYLSCSCGFSHHLEARLVTRAQSFSLHLGHVLSLLFGIFNAFYGLFFSRFPPFKEFLSEVPSPLPTIPGRLDWLASTPPFSRESFFGPRKYVSHFLEDSF